MEKKQLSEKEEKALPVVIALLKNSQDAKTSLEISREIQVVQHTGLRSVQIRKLINHIRINHLVERVLAISKGYYVSDNDDEIREYINSLQGRIHEIDEVRKSLYTTLTPQELW